MMKRLVLLTIAAVSLMGSSARRDAYIISSGDNNTYQAASSLDELQSVRKRVTGRYIWVRRDGREYVIRDEATMARVKTLFAPLSALHPEQKAISREEVRLDREADRLSDKEHLTSAERQRLRDLREQLRDVERREKALDDKEEALERDLERTFWDEMDSAIRGGVAKPTAATRR
ncbi:MAG TPA: hypothetical protein VJ901_21070 [Thermoanaerobaculia bacterium]|nr:hypothetical protein [Thermoanaerobaculia bacterium]